MTEDLKAKIASFVAAQPDTPLVRAGGVLDFLGDLSWAVSALKAANVALDKIQQVVPEICAAILLGTKNIQEVVQDLIARLGG